MTDPSRISRETAESAARRIGQRLAALRTERNVRVSELARLAGVSSSLISQIERGHSRPSVETLFAVASVLQVPVDDFFAEADGDTPDSAPTVSQDAPPLPPIAGISRNGAAEWNPTDSAPRERYVVRRGHRASLDIQGGVRWERLTPTALDGVEFLELVYAPGAESAPQSYRHPGVELVLVTLGCMTIFLGFEQYDLDAGDAISFPSSTPHRYVNLTDAEARAITVIFRDDLSTLELGDGGSR